MDKKRLLIVLSAGILCVTASTAGAGSLAGYRPLDGNLNDLAGTANGTFSGGPAADDPNLVGWWTLDDGSGTVAKDSGGLGNDGACNGNPQWTFGYFGGGLEFDGTDDYVDCGNDSSLDLTTWTIAFWLKAAQNKNYSGFVVKGVDAAENYEVLGFGDGSMHLPITFSDGTRTFVNTAAGTIVVGEWTHFAYSYHSTKGRRFYKDGALIYSDAPSGTPQSSTDPLTIGNERPLSRFVDGIMDDVRIYNRALTDAEIKQVGARPKAYAPNPPDGALAVSVPLLLWTPATFAVLHSVYLGTDPNLTEANLVASRQAMLMYYHIPGFTPGATYYWRVDEIEKDGVTTHTGDVWTFMTQALTAYYPSPADKDNTVSPTPALTWMPGAGAVQHRVYFGTDANAVGQGAADTDKGILAAADTIFVPAALENLTTYFWRVDELGLGGAVKTGPLWSFTTALVVDDFESYTDNDDGARIFDTWIDGYADNSSGSTVGNIQAPFAERTIVHDANQAMPLDYNNVNSPFYSEAEREFAPAEDWTADGVDTLVLYVRGRAGNSTASLYVAISDSAGKSASVVHPDAVIVSATKWTEWKIPLTSFAGVNLARVKTLVIGVGDRADPQAGGTGRIYIDDIRLAKPAP